MRLIPTVTKSRMSDPTGILLVDKPQGITSHDVVARTRRSLGTKKVGHAGTLDPMATGLLVLGVGRGTKLLTHAVGLRKTYLATIRLGYATTTDDAEGEVTTANGFGDSAGVEEAMSELRGSLMQVPSSVSAIKVAGRRAYARVRAGEEVALAPRPVQVTRFDRLADIRESSAEVGGNTVPVADIDVLVECSTGTYVRALARDLGAALGCGGHLTALRRTEVGPWNVTQADDELISLEQACLALYPETVAVDEAGARAFRHGIPPFAENRKPEEYGQFSVVWGETVLGIAKPQGGRIRAAFIIDPA